MARAPSKSGGRSSPSKSARKPGDSRAPGGPKKSSRATAAQKPGQRARAEEKDAKRARAAGPPSRPKSASSHPSGKSPFQSKGKSVSAEAGMTLGKWVALESGETVSVREAKRLLEAGHCRVNGRVETFASRVLAAGDVVDLQLPERREKWVAQAFDRTRVVYEDDVILAYDKPNGLAVVAPDGKRTENLAALVAAQYPGIEPVHRIDSDTTGIVLFAKTRAVQTALEEAFKAHTVEKVYLAIVRGHPRHEGMHRSYLVKVDAGRGFERWVPAQTSIGKEGREAITRWKLVERLGLYASLVEVRPETGRHHQIRIHMSDLGHGLLGDTRYGDRRDPVSIARHMLHAAEITFTHPISQKPLTLKAALPHDFRAAMAKLKAQ